MKRLITAVLLAAAAPIWSSGCSETDYDDVQAAREQVREEERETGQVREEVAQQIDEERGETAEAIRHESLKPETPEAVREERQETAEARREGAERIAEEQRETEEARRELAETKRKYEAQQSRDSYVKRVEAVLESAQKRIETLEDRVTKLEGTAEVELQNQVNELKTRDERVRDQLGKLKGAEVTNWESHRDEVQRALKDLQQELDEAK